MNLNKDKKKTSTDVNEVKKQGKKWITHLFEQM